MARSVEASIPRTGPNRNHAVPISDEAWGTLASAMGLSERELQVVQAVISDGTESAIARKLGISTHTVHAHLDRIHKKLGVTDRVGLVVRVFAEYVARYPAATAPWPPNLAASAARRSALRIPRE